MTTAEKTAEQTKNINTEKLNEAESHSSMATNLYKMNRYAEAYEHFNKAKSIYEQIDEKNKLYTQLRYMGIVKENLNNIAKAIEHYNESKKGFEALADFDEMGETSYRLATCLFRENKTEEAIKEYEYAASKNCKNPNVYNNLGFLQIDSGDLKNAGKNLTSANELAKDEIQDLILNNLGVVSYLSSDYKKADEYLNKALSVSSGPKGERTIQYIVFCNEKYSKITTEKFTMCDEVLTQASIYLNLAATAVQLGNTEQAKDYCRKALDVDGNMSYTQLPAAWIYLAADDKEKAITYFKNAIQSNPEKEYIREIVKELNPYAFMKIERNEDCPCGSGKKFKKCHGK